MSNLLPNSPKCKIFLLTLTIKKTTLQMEGQNVLKPQVCVVMVPFPAQGHLNQLLHLSYLISSYGLPVHYVGSTTHNHQAKLRLQGWHSTHEDGNGLVRNIHFHDFELPPHDTPPPNPNPSMQFPGHLLPLWEASMNIREPVSKLLKQMSTEHRRIVVINDTMMAYVVQDAREIVNAEVYSFAPCSSFQMFYSSPEIKNDKLPCKIDSDIVPTRDVPSTDGCYTPEMMTFFADKLGPFSHLNNGTLLNTSRVIEGKYVELHERITGQKCFAIGPLNPVETVKHEEGAYKHNECLEWLDKQVKNSVIYVSFGTMTSITDEQIKELAIGLENSGQKFIWALRDADKADVSTVYDAVRRPYLPERYEERVNDRGIVVRNWAPQLEILGHSSTGGFLSHCGWNSCIESISMGVPMATWPMHSDQPRNAVLVTTFLRVGIVVRDWGRRGEVVSSRDVERAVRQLMASEDGMEMRERAAKLGEDVRRSVCVGGCSHLERESFIAHITR